MIPKKIILLLFLLPSVAFPQGLLDSLTKKLDRAATDSARIELYYIYSLKKKLVSKTTDSLKEKIRKFTESQNCATRCYALLKLGFHEDVKGFDKLAVDYYLQSLKLAEECRDMKGMARATNRLGILNMKLRNYKGAVPFLQQSAAYALKSNDKVDLAEDYNQLGTAFKEMSRIDSSLYYHFAALKLREELGVKKNIGNVLNNIGLTYKKGKDYEKAVEYLTRALEIRKEINDKKGVAGACINLANCYRDLGKFKEALMYARQGTDLANSLREGEFFRNGVGALAELTYKMKDYKASAYYFKRHKSVEDSLNLKIIDKNLQEIQTKYESDKKDMELKRKEDTIKLAESENSRKNVLILFSSIALFMTLIAVIFIYRSYRINKKSAASLSVKNRQIEEKNKEITDSINYARNIQHSLLTSEQVFKENLSDHFILFKPKDIVSGDFYWARKVDQDFLIMCADCTGHGVPGAFMSLLGITHLNEICGNLHTLRPDLILNLLRSGLIESFSLNDHKDGMDAALIKLNGFRLEVAAANNPLWIIRNNSNMVVKANKFPIGKHYGAMEDFSLNTVQLEEGDLVVMFTDGFADQFGGARNKKYKYKRLEQFIIERSQLPLAELKQMLETELEEWKGKNEQLDDILVIGFRV